MSLLFQRGRIERAVLGELPPGRESALRRHLAGCADCRAHYDDLSRAAQALGMPAATSHRRERARLLAALPEVGAVASTVAAPAPRRRRVLIPASSVLMPAAAAAALALLWPRPASDGGAPTITWRGGGGEPAAGGADDPARARLLVYASRKGKPGERPGPLRLVADLPGAGEGKVSVGDYLQLGYRGLTAPAYVAVAAVDDSGTVHQYLPAAGASPLRVEPAPQARAIGPSLDLGRRHRPGRLRLVALFSPAPLGAAQVRAAAVAAAAGARPRGDDSGAATAQVGGIITVEP